MKREGWGCSAGQRAKKGRCRAEGGNWNPRPHGYPDPITFRCLRSKSIHSIRAGYCCRVFTRPLFQYNKREHRGSAGVPRCGILHEKSKCQVRYTSVRSLGCTEYTRVPTGNLGE